ncbi:Uncharacterized protein QTN25_001533 [Entamoeba marina]
MSLPKGTLPSPLGTGPMPSFSKPLSSTPISYGIKPFSEHPSSIDEGTIMKNQYISQPSRIISSDFLTRKVLLQRLRSILIKDSPKEPLYLGEGVSEIICASAYEKLWQIVQLVGKASESRVNPGDGMKVHFLDTPTDTIRKELKIEQEKKPKEGRRDGKRVIRVSMKDIYRVRRALPKGSFRRYETRKLHTKNK